MAKSFVYSALLLSVPTLFPFPGGVNGLSIPHDGHWPRGLVNPQGLIDIINETAYSETGPVTDELRKRAGNPADFSWIKRWAAVGDSFTAGIGAGTPKGSRVKNTKDWECSRYDQSYVEVLNRAFGPSVDDFQFVACSGDRTEDIYHQVQNMQGNLDLVIMTAGGNDLCLADMIKACVFMKSSEADCQAVIDIAQNNLRTILGDNMKQVLRALNDKMKPDGIVIYNGYAQFFNTDRDDDCGDQDWTLLPILGTALPLKLSRRKTFNNLVVQINDLIKNVVKDIAGESGIKYKIGFSNWDPWVYKGVSGQFCDPKSTGAYPDKAQPDLQFFKPDTAKGEPGDELKRRDGLEGTSPASRDAYALTRDKIYKSSLLHSRNPAAVALKRLDPRAPSPPNCPSDGSSLPSVPVPDSVGKNFHPNELGHVTIASCAMAELMDLRAEQLGVSAPACELVDRFTCWQSTGRRSYASANLLDENYKSFCNKDMRVVKRGSAGWIGSYTYHQGTPEEQVFAVQLSPGTSTTDQDAIRRECEDSFKRIIHGCDGNDPANPMNWKFGGQWVRGKNTWEVTALGKRPWPMIQSPHGKCEGWYHGVWSSYEMYGSGWATSDWGQKALLPNIEGCTGGESSLWHFDYLDPPTSEGYEWKASFNELIWVRARCFANNKVAFASGGFTNGCGGND